MSATTLTTAADAVLFDVALSLWAAANLPRWLKRRSG